MEWLRAALSRELLRQNIPTSLAVGALLTGINQWEGLFAPAELSLSKLLLTFLVPFLVSSYSAVKAKMHFATGYRSARDIQLECAECRKCSIQVRKGETIPECPICREDTDWRPKAGPAERTE
jgi:hypothetical protein